MTSSTKPARAPAWLFYFMAFTCSLVVGNIYFSQPLLGHIAREFSLSETSVSILPLLTQIGYAIGIFLLVPLGDQVVRKKLLLVTLSLAGLAALGISVAPDFLWLKVLFFTVGFLNVTPTVLIPFAAELAPPEEQGKTVGLILSGILIGALLARSFAGSVGLHFGWRAVYVFSGCACLTLAFLNYALLPTQVPSFKGRYLNLLRSTLKLVFESRVLREASLIGALLFASFNAFWTTLVFLLEGESWKMTSQTAGLFGLIGAGGALAAPIFGRLSDKKGAHWTLQIGLVMTLLAFVLLGLSTTHLAGLIIGVLLLDVGIQMSHVTNQSRIYAFRPEARSRLNSIYVFAYFVGGGLGSLVGALLWSWMGWVGVCVGGFLLVFAAWLSFFRSRPR